MADIIQPPPRLATVAFERALIALVLLSAFAVQSIYGWSVQKTGTHGYLIGDWTISYSGGFVRRGLFGSLLLTIFTEPESALVALWFAQTMLYAVMFGTVLYWVVTVPEPRRWVMLLLSPAFVMFSVNDLEGSHRKEILALAALLILANACLSGRLVRVSVSASLALFVLAAFSHELNGLLIVPFLVLLHWAALDGLISTLWRRAASVAFVLVALGGVGAAILRPGTVHQRDAICDDLIDRGFAPQLCDGSLSFVGAPAGGQFEAVLSGLSFSLSYVVPAALAILALVYVPWARRNARLLIAANIGTAPLFGLGLDWGRWIMLAVMVTTILAVVGSRREGTQPDHVPLHWILIYVLCWRVPHIGGGWTSLGPSRLIPETIRAAEVLLQAFPGRAT